MQPSFTTQRLFLRPRQLADLEACLAMDSDPAVTRFIPGPWADPQQHRAFVLQKMQSSYPADMGYWSVCQREDTAVFLGWVFLTPYQTDAKVVEIGWRFNANAWGQGFATEAAHAIIQHAFLSTDCRRIIAEIAPDNAGSIRVANKLNMQFAGEHSSATEHNLLYAMTHQQFALQHQQ